MSVTAFLLGFGGQHAGAFSCSRPSPLAAMLSRILFRFAAALLAGVAVAAGHALATGRAQTPLAAFAALVGFVAAIWGAVFCLQQLNRTNGE